jgi:voltage-gated potassium channel
MKASSPRVTAPSRRTDRSAKQASAAVGLVLLTVVMGTAGFVVIEGWPVGEAAYMTIISITTTGFGEVRPLSPAGRGLTVFIIVSGITSIAYAGGRVLQLAVELYLIRRGRMDRHIDRLHDHVILCGFGRMGRHVASDLTEAHIPFVVLDADPEIISELEDLGYLHIIGDASSDDVLKAAGVERARGLIAVVSSDAENVYTTLTAKSLNPEITIVARAVSDESEPKLRIAGADRVIKPYELVGRRIAQLVIRPAMVEFVDTIARSRTGEIMMEEITVSDDSTLVGKSLRDTSIRSELNVIIVAVRRGQQDLIYNPGPGTVLTGGDRLVAIGAREKLLELSRMCGIEAP